MASLPSQELSTQRPDIQELKLGALLDAPWPDTALKHSDPQMIQTIQVYH